MKIDIRRMAKTLNGTGRYMTNWMMGRHDRWHMQAFTYGDALNTRRQRLALSRANRGNWGE